MTNSWLKPKAEHIRFSRTRVKRQLTVFLSHSLRILVSIDKTRSIASWNSIFLIGSSYWWSLTSSGLSDLTSYRRTYKLITRHGKWWHEKKFLRTYAYNYDSNQPSHPSNLISLHYSQGETLHHLQSNMCTVKILIRLCKRARWSRSLLGAYVWR